MESRPRKALLGELTPGTTFGPYCILSHLATGGMAEIYLARATKIRGFQRLVVVKRIRPDSAQNEEFVEMFLDEARLVASLQHAHIAQVFDIGEFDGNYFFTMEFVRGEEVAGLLRRAWQERKTIPLHHVLNIVIQAASGLHYAHSRRDGNGDLRGIIHRDVSPSNILVGSEGSVKVIDFGVAKAADQEHKTTVGALKGKLAYMSPEQVTAKKVDRRSDVFSLGIVLYEMLTGQRLFKGDSDFLILNKVMNAEIEPPSVVRTDCPSQLDAIVLKALSRDVDERYRSCEELQIALEECAYDNELKLSQRGLAQYLDTTFPEKRDFWEASQREDSSVEEFLVSNPTIIKAQTGTLDPTEYDALSRSDIVLEEIPSKPSTPWKMPLPSGSATEMPSNTGQNASNSGMSSDAIPLRAPALESSPLLIGLGEYGNQSNKVEVAASVNVPRPTITPAQGNAQVGPAIVGPQLATPLPPIAMVNSALLPGVGPSGYPVVGQPVDAQILPNRKWLLWAGGGTLLLLLTIIIASVGGSDSDTTKVDSTDSYTVDTPVLNSVGQDAGTRKIGLEPKPKEVVEAVDGIGVGGNKKISNPPLPPDSKKVEKVERNRTPATNSNSKNTSRREKRLQARAALLAKKKREREAAAENKRKADAKSKTKNVDSLFLPSGGR